MKYWRIALLMFALLANYVTADEARDRWIMSTDCFHQYRDMHEYSLSKSLNECTDNYRALELFAKLPYSHGETLQQHMDSRFESIQERVKGVYSGRLEQVWDTGYFTMSDVRTDRRLVYRRLSWTYARFPNEIVKSGFYVGYSISLLDGKATIKEMVEF